MGEKFVLHHFGHLQARWKKEKFYHSLLPHIVDVHPYKNNLLPRYRVPQNAVKVILPPS